MSKLNLVCCQYDIAWEKRKENYATVTYLLQKAQLEKNSLIILPEMFSTGFSMNTAYTADRDCLDLKFLEETAQRFQSWVVGGVVREQMKSIYNQAIVFDREGKEICSYSKSHLFPLALENKNYARGTEVKVVEIAGFKLAPFICYDLRFPESFRAAAVSGAELFVVIANWPAARELHWCSLLQARAIENQAFVAAVNRCGNDPLNQYSGRSQVIDPWGIVKADGQSGTCVLQFEIDIGLVRSYRQQYPFLKDMI